MRSRHCPASLWLPRRFRPGVPEHEALCVCVQEEYIGTAVSYALGVQRAQHIRIVSTWDEEQDSEQQRPSTSLAAEAAQAQAKVRARIKHQLLTRLHLW